jgi:hypothetical protein
MIALWQTDHWLLTTDYWLFRNGGGASKDFPGHQGIAGQTPPAPSGATAAKFCQNSGAAAHQGRPTVPSSPQNWQKKFILLLKWFILL